MARRERLTALALALLMMAALFTAAHADATPGLHHPGGHPHRHAVQVVALSANLTDTASHRADQHVAVAAAGLPVRTVGRGTVVPTRRGTATHATASSVHVRGPPANAV